MNQRTDHSTSTTRPVARSTLSAIVLIGALTVTPAHAASTAESVARETLLAALAPALAVRGATAVVTVTPLDARRLLEPCNQMTGFMPPGSRLAGRTVVGVRCVDGAAWQAFVAAEVRVEGPAWQATRALRAGETLTAGDVVRATATMTAPDLDVAAAVARTGTNGGNAVRGLASLDGRDASPSGRIVLRPVAMGRALTAGDVRDEGRIAAGDAVRVVYAGENFSVTSEGRAVGTADPGGNVMIRLASGAFVNGTLRADRLVELPH